MRQIKITPLWGASLLLSVLERRHSLYTQALLASISKKENVHLSQANTPGKLEENQRKETGKRAASAGKRAANSQENERKTCIQKGKPEAIPSKEKPSAGLKAMQSIASSFN